MFVSVSVVHVGVNVWHYVGRNKKRVLNHDDEISLATKKNKGKLYTCTVHITAYPAV